jgi:hypothetical protein
MTKLHRLSNWTILADLLIIIGAGHGIVPLGLMEPFIIHHFKSEYFSFALKNSYDNSIGAAALFSMSGQLLLLASMFVKNAKGIFYSKALGLFFMWTGFLYLTHSMFQGNSLATFTFFTGLPFLTLSVLLCIQLIKVSFLKDNEKVTQLQKG